MREAVMNFLEECGIAYHSSMSRRGALWTWFLILTAPVRLAWFYTGLLLQLVGGYMSGMK